MICFQALLPTYKNYPLFKDSGSCDQILNLLRMMGDTGQMEVISFVIVPDWIQLVFLPKGAHSPDSLIFMFTEEADVILKRYHSRTDLAYLPNALCESIKINPNWAIFDVPFTILDVVDNKHLQNTIDSMHQLPVKMGLSRDPFSYSYSSASHPELVTV